MENYFVKQISDDTWLINDKSMCSVYLIVGTCKALVIDTGMGSDDSLLNKIREITDKPLEVALTHAHYDHIGHTNEFESFYLCRNDLISLRTNQINLQKCILFDDEISFDLGNKTIKAKAFEGHTHGSTIFFDEQNKNMFTGDQFGSGCGAWGQVFEAVCISQYKKSIINFLEYTSCNFNIELDEWNLWGGHYGQEHSSRLGYNPLNMNLVRNMAVLCDKILANEVELQPSGAKEFNDEKSYYVQYGTAELIIRKSLIK